MLFSTMGRQFAITSKGKTLKSCVDLRFGTCEYLVIHRPGDEVSRLIENPYKNEDETGLKLAMFLKENEITSIITGGVGVNVSNYLALQKLQLIQLEEEQIRIEEILGRIG
jgi:predicted Fe-Mo cluster-binding NifX family protein